MSLKTTISQFDEVITLSRRGILDAEIKLALMLFEPQALTIEGVVAEALTHEMRFTAQEIINRIGELVTEHKLIFQMEEFYGSDFFAPTNNPDPDIVSVLRINHEYKEVR